MGAPNRNRHAAVLRNITPKPRRTMSERNDTTTGRVVRLLIGALGGEGGGLLATWLVSAANRAGLPVQGTSLPGTSQRTGATTYFVEMLSAPAPEGKHPVFSLYPVAGELDLVVASEMIEVGRMIQSGYVSKDRTVLIGSTHRVLTIDERQAMGDGRFDTSRTESAAHELSRQTFLLDLEQESLKTGAPMNAIIFGMIAGSGVYPVDRVSCVGAIEEAGVGVKSSTEGFNRGIALIEDAGGLASPSSPSSKDAKAADRDSLDANITDKFPEALHEVLQEGVRQTRHYQNRGYASRYLERLSKVLAAEGNSNSDYPVTADAAKRLAVWMTYEDVIRVAQIKTSRERFEEIRSDVKAEPGETVHVIDYLKPGLEEIASIMPRSIGARLMRRAERTPTHKKRNIGLHIKTTSVSGFLLMRVLSILRPWRPRTFRFQHEQAWIERWLTAIIAGTSRAPELGLEISRVANLVKGYGDIHARGKGNLTLIFDSVIAKGLKSDVDAGTAAAQIAGAGEAALADENGNTLARYLETIST